MEGENSQGNGTCHICLTNSVKYVCPRCNIPYCSVDCYRSEKHAQCSEDFYKECVTDELRSLEPNTADSCKKMIDVLKRLNDIDLDSPDFEDDEEGAVVNKELDSDDDPFTEEEDLQSRLKDADLDNADEVWSKLNAEEKAQFEKLLESGDISSILPDFEPWWDYRDDRKIIDLEVESYFDKVHKSKCPKINKNIVPLITISKSPPASVVCYNLVNILAAYTFAVRYFVGDHQKLCDEAALAIITLSKNLSCNQNFEDFHSAVESVVFEIKNCTLLETSVDSSNEIKNDVIKILKGPDINNLKFYILAALCDIHSLFLRYAKIIKTKPLSSDSEFSKLFPNSSGVSTKSPTVTKQLVKNYTKKIEYYQSWVVEYYKYPIGHLS